MDSVTLRHLTISRRIKAGEIRVVKVGNRNRIPYSEVARLRQQMEGGCQDRLETAATIPVTDEVVDSYAVLSHLCRVQGHALHDKIHTGDRWVAASAIAMGLPLLAGDQIYNNAPGLQLVPWQIDSTG
jgi:hypothetical protein